MTHPRLLDLFCGAGGCSVGYYRAGFDVVGVDHVAQPDYPFEFHQADATTYPLDGFDAVHASPPCKLFTAYRRKLKTLPAQPLFDPHVDLLTPTLARLGRTDLPWIVENVPGAPGMEAARQLCGSSFGLEVRRHRLFLSNWSWTAPSCQHDRWVNEYPHAGNRTNPRRTVEVGAWRIPVELAQQALGVDWCSERRSLSQMIPPAYTQWIGDQLLFLTTDGSAA